MAALNTLRDLSAVARSLGAWVAPGYCALDAGQVQQGLDEGVRRRAEAVVTDVIDTARRLSLEGA